jgi:preprotein translocase subunit SecA
MFEELMHSIWEEFSKLVFHAEIEVDPSQLEGAFAATAAAAGPRSTTPAAPRSAALGAAAGRRRRRGALPAARRRQRRPSPEAIETVVKDEREKNIGRNDPCWCGQARSTRSAMVLGPP